jgi:crotonobetainyl-CoA:carnitine CoA-transferase CaiB-like acyl-CoA transferase
MATRLPLEGIKILDFMWVMAGPASTRFLADYGATIVRIESPTRIDTARTLQPYKDGKLGPDSSGLFNNCNAGKLGIALDLKNPRAKEVVFDLLRWADVVTESFSPRAMRAWGLDYQSLSAVKPDIVMLSSCLMGQSGPLAGIAGFGNMAAAISGFHNLTGWADRPPAGPFGAYTDYVSPRYAAAAILAALDHRRRTGQGQYIDLSQAEASLHFLGPALLDYTVNGRTQSRRGNSDTRFAPHGVYPAAGDDAWVAIVCRDDRDFGSLCDAIGQAKLKSAPDYATAAERLKRTDALDATIAQWSRTLAAERVEAILQERGVPAHQVQNSAGIFRDPQVKHLEHFVERPHPTLGTFTVEGPRAKLSRTPAEVRRSAPSVGQDNAYVLETILGYGEDRITELVVDGLFG